MLKEDIIKSAVSLKEEINGIIDSSTFDSLTVEQIIDKFVEIGKEHIKDRLLNQFKAIANSDDFDKQLPYISKKANIVNDFLFKLNFANYIDISLLLKETDLLYKIEHHYEENDKYHNFSKLFKILELEQADFYADVSLKRFYNASSFLNLFNFTHTDTYYNIRSSLRTNIEQKLPKDNRISFYCFINYYYKHPVTEEMIFYYNKVYHITYDNDKFNFENISAKESDCQLNFY